ncbi:MAG TPA: amidohydrolase family protein [Bacillota bacterium]
MKQAYIDFHSHAFADKIVGKAVSFLQDYYGIPTEGRTGRLADLIKTESKAGCAYFVLMVSATKPSQVPVANDWSLSASRLSRSELSTLSGLSNPARPIAFGTLHPGYTEMEKELSRLKAAGIPGLKIHPEFQGFSLDDPLLYPLYESIGENFILLTHIGDKSFSQDNYSTPRKLKKVLSNFPKLKAVAAHLGGYNCWTEAYNELAGSDLYLDLSSTLGYIDPCLLAKFVKTHDQDRLLFGSDYPLGDPRRELDFLAASKLFTGALWEKVTRKNAETLLSSVGFQFDPGK